MLRRVKQYIYEKYLHENWNIGFINSSLHDVLQSDSWDIIWLKHNYKDRFFADPFILEITEKHIIVLAEEFYYPKFKGRISKLTIDKESYILLDNKIILELDTHLSFPIIFRHNSEIYIYPENSASEKLQLFQYDAEHEKTTPVSVLCEQPFTDAVISLLFGKPTIFTTVQPLNSDRELHIYQASQWDGKYTQLLQTILFEEKIARSAGAIFEYEGMILRPAQDCDKRYGKGLVFQKITVEQGVFSCSEYKRFYPTSRQYPHGLHTFNFMENHNIIAIDGYNLPLSNRILIKLMNFYSMLRFSH